MPERRDHFGYCIDCQAPAPPSEKRFYWHTIQAPAGEVVICPRCITRRQLPAKILPMLEAIGRPQPKPEKAEQGRLL